jgi:Universal stress protein family
MLTTEAVERATARRIANQRTKFRRTTAPADRPRVCNSGGTIVTIICGTDFSEGADHAARAAGAFARRLGVPLKLVHVIAEATLPFSLVQTEVCHLAQLATETGSDLLVVGTHQRSWAARSWQGSVSRGALHHATSNVACIPPSWSATGEAPVPSSVVQND